MKDEGVIAISMQICSMVEGVSVEPDANDLLDGLADLHGFDTARRCWWESFGVAKTFNYGNSVDEWARCVEVLLSDMGRPVFLVVTDDEFPPWPVLRVDRGVDIVEVIGGFRFFEYFVFSRDLSRVFFDFHDNVLVSSC